MMRNNSYYRHSTDGGKLVYIKKILWTNTHH
jgi:hypothetical protein